MIEMRACLVLAAAIMPAAAMGADYQLAWSQTYDSATHSHDAAHGVAGTPAGEVVVIGYERRADLAEGRNILIKKYDSAGRQTWWDSYNSGSDSDDRGKDVAIGADGAMIAAGYAASLTTTSTGWIRKYSASGAEQWTATFNKSGTAETRFEGVAVDKATQAIYLAGACRVGSYWDGLLVKYTDAGTLVWSVTYDGAAKVNDEFFDVAVDGEGSVLITGYCGMASNNFDILVAKYSPGGAPIWQKTYGCAPSGDDYRDCGYGIASDEGNNVYVAGILMENSAGSLIDSSRWVRKYSPSGAYVSWTAIYKRGDEDDAGLDLALGGDGALYVAGWSYVYDAYKGKDLTVDKLSCQNGSIVQLFDYHADRGTYNTNARDEIGYGIAAWTDSRFVVVGSEDREDINQGLNWTVLCYSLIPGLLPSRANIRTYPNPFRPSRAVEGAMKFVYLPSGARVRIFTLGGRLVRELSEQGNVAAWDGRSENGDEMPTGAYYYLVLIPGEREARGKFAIIRP